MTIEDFAVDKVMYLRTLVGTAALLHKLGVGDITTPWTQVCECSNSRMGQCRILKLIPCMYLLKILEKFKSLANLKVRGQVF